MAATGGLLLANAPAWLVYLGAAVAASSITLTRPIQAAILPSLSRTPEPTAANGRRRHRHRLDAGRAGAGRLALAVTGSAVASLERRWSTYRPCWCAASTPLRLTRSRWTRTPHGGRPSRRGGWARRAPARANHAPSCRCSVRPRSCGARWTCSSWCWRWMLALGESGVGFLERRAEPVACWAPPSASAWSGGAAWPDRSASASCSGRAGGHRPDLERCWRWPAGGGRHRRVVMDVSATTSSSGPPTHGCWLACSACWRASTWRRWPSDRSWRRCSSR